jgi:hypothetical protein
VLAADDVGDRVRDRLRVDDAVAEEVDDVARGEGERRRLLDRDRLVADAQALGERLVAAQQPRELLPRKRVRDAQREQRAQPTARVARGDALEQLRHPAGADVDGRGAQASASLWSLVAGLRVIVDRYITDPYRL